MELFDVSVKCERELNAIGGNVKIVYIFIFCNLFVAHLSPISFHRNHLSVSGVKRHKKNFHSIFIIKVASLTMTTKKPPNIQITHFINPHLFWYKTAGKSNVSQKSAIEYKLSEFAKRCYNQKFAENVGAKIAVSDYVAVYYLNEKKWIRATVEKINPSSDGSMILWADDYGFPMECSKNLVISLDDELKQLCLNADLHVYRAGIHGIMPASYQLNVCTIHSFYHFIMFTSNVCLFNFDVFFKLFTDRATKS